MHLFKPTFQKIPRIFCGNYFEIERPNFGNVFDFWKSWNGRDYVEFREKYERRVKEYNKIFDEAFISPYSLQSKIRMVFEKILFQKFVRHAIKLMAFKLKVF